MPLPIYQSHLSDHLSDLLDALEIEKTPANYRKLLWLQIKCIDKADLIADIETIINSDNEETKQEAVTRIWQQLPQKEVAEELNELCDQLVNLNNSRKAADTEDDGKTLDDLPENLESSLIFSAQYGDLELLKQLIPIITTNDTQPIATTNIFAYLFLIAAYYGQAKIMTCLAENGPPPDTLNTNGDSIVHIAAQEGHLDILQWAKDNGLPLETLNANGDNIMHLAAEQGHPLILEWAQTNTTAWNQENNDGATPLQYAICNGHDKCVRILMDADLNRETLPLIAALAAVNGEPLIINTLAQYAIDLNTPSNDGFSPCFIAAQFGQVDALISLIIHQANDAAHCTPRSAQMLRDVFTNDYPQAVNAMEAFIATQPDQNNITMSPKDIAQIFGHTNIVSLLENKEALKVLRGFNLLSDRIAQLELHANNLLRQTDKRSQDAGKAAKTLVTQLRNTADDFVTETVQTSTNLERIKKLQMQFKTQLDEGYKKLGTHRAAWKPILLNIAIAATGIGLLLVIVKTLYSGHAFFAETKRQQHIKDIIDVADSFVPQSNP